MKKLIKTLSSLIITSLIAFSCSNEISDSKVFLPAMTGSGSSVAYNDSRSGSDPVSITFHVMYTPAETKEWNIWAWRYGTKEQYNTGADWPGTSTLENDSETGYYKITLSNIKTSDDLGIIFVGKTGSPQTKDLILPKEKLIDGKDYYFIYNDATPFESKEACSGLKSGNIISKDCKTVNLSIFGKSNATKNDFTVTDKSGNALSVISVTASDTTAELYVSDGSFDKIPYTVTVGGQTITANITSNLIDELGLKYDGNDLGVTINGSEATYKVWAPTASKVELLLYSDVANIGTFKAETVNKKFIGGTDEVELEGTPSDTVEMNNDPSTGIWSLTRAIGSDKYYKYKITFGDEVRYVCDINAKVCAPDSIAAQIMDIDDANAKPDNWETSYTNPFGNTGAEVKKYNDAVIYEMHIRDWSRAVVNDSTGKFLDFAKDEVINHLKDIGVTHVQILPMFDYAQVNADKKYNWGYNPYHYNVPEGRYVTDNYTDGTQAVREMRAMIAKLHQNDIAVIMDVVYNHTNGTGTGSLYDSTVPGYFYRLDEAGSYINGSGCGNEIATNNYMVRKYVIDSLKHWMNDYHINGFRFDLMGCLEDSTMKEIYDALYKIDKNVLVYGEPWTGGTSGVSSGATGAGKGESGYGYGAFDDDFRDAVKGAEFGGFALGQVQGTFNDAGIVNGLQGISGKNNRNTTEITGLSLRYVECHDNYTLFDKLVYSTLPSNKLTGDFAPEFSAAYKAVMEDAEKLKKIKAQVKLAGAYVMLAQGTPFINGGQEFLRTKKGNPDSYAPDKKGGIEWTTQYGDGGSYDEKTDIDDVNTINLSMKETYSDVYNTYKALISFRKNTGSFRSPTKTNANTLTTGVTLYSVEGEDGNFDVYFNASDNTYLISDAHVTGSVLGAGIKDTGVMFGTKGQIVTIDETNGTYSIAATVSNVKSVPAKSFVILKK